MPRASARRTEGFQRFAGRCSLLGEAMDRWWAGLRGRRLQAGEALRAGASVWFVQFAAQKQAETG